MPGPKEDKKLILLQAGIPDESDDVLFGLTRILEMAAPDMPW